MPPSLLMRAQTGTFVISSQIYRTQKQAKHPVLPSNFPHNAAVPSLTRVSLQIQDLIYISRIEEFLKTNFDLQTTCHILKSSYRFTDGEMKFRQVTKRQDEKVVREAADVVKKIQGERTHNNVNSYGIARKQKQAANLDEMEFHQAPRKAGTFCDA